MSVPSKKSLISSLMKRIRAYDKFFKAQEAAAEPLNHQAHTAYINLVKLVHAIGPEDKPDTEPSGKRIKEILREVYGIEPDGPDGPDGQDENDE